jgi:hypothetical protein
MTQQDYRHSITPPPELVRQWMEHTEYDEHTWFYESYIAEQAAQWGADQELVACCHYFARDLRESLALELRAARRPKPPSLKEQALQALNDAVKMADDTPPEGICSDQANIIRRALEQLDD